MENGMITMVTNDTLTKRIIAYEVIWFGIALFIIWAVEIFDLPHFLGFRATPINWPECWIETSVVLPLGIFTIFETWRCLKRIKHLEGFLRVCTFCKKILVKNEWIPIEQYIQEHSETEFSHGLCSQCMEKHYGVKAGD
jgi:hypothetical protein